MNSALGQKIQPLVKYKVDLIVPCHNPARGWEVKFTQEVNQLAAHLAHCSLHLILVDDGSKKNFSEIQEAYFRKNIADLTIVRNEKNYGKGKAIRNGLMQSQSPFVLYTDADLPYNAESVVRVINQLIAGADLVFGVRSERYYENLPLQRKIISKALQLFNRHILRLPIIDSQCGLKGLSLNGKRCLEHTKSNSYLFDLELMMAAHQQKGLKVETALAQTSSHFQITNLSLKTLFREMLALVKILFKR